MSYDAAGFTGDGQHWTFEALCRTEGHPSWWDDQLDGPTEGPRARGLRHERAKAVCRRCPVFDQCRQHTDVATDDGIRFAELLSDVRAADRRRLSHEQRLRQERGRESA